MQTLIQVIYYTNIIILIFSILLQSKAAGLSSTFGGGDAGFFRKKRGMEKTLHITSIIASIIFIGMSFAFPLF